MCCSGSVLIQVVLAALEQVARQIELEASLHEKIRKQKATRQEIEEKLQKEELIDIQQFEDNEELIDIQQFEEDEELIDIKELEE